MNNQTDKQTRRPSELRLPFLLPPITRYVFALLCVGIAVLVRMYLDPFLSQDQLVLSFFYMAVLATSWFGNWGPSIFCIVLGFLAMDWFFLTPRSSFFISTPHLITTASYFLITIPIAAFGYLIRKSQLKTRQNEEMLREKEEQLRVALQGAQAAMWVWDLHDNWYTSPLTNSIFGRPSDSPPIKLNEFSSFIHPEDFPRVSQAWQNTVNSGQPYDQTYRIIWQDKQVHWLRSQGTVREMHDGKILFIGISKDMTNQKEAEEVLRKDKDEFKRQVREGSARLLRTERELDKSKRLSDIGTLASTVAHELRNPLAAIGIAVHNIKKKSGKEQLEKHISTVEKKIQESDQIINNLLFYSKLQSPHFETVNIVRLLKESLELSRTMLAGRKDISMGLDTDAAGKILMDADPLQIKEVFSNILNNSSDALKGTETGKIEIKIRDDAHSVMVSFKDNGVGMNKETLLRATEPFYSTKSKGTGLGLSVSKQIIGLHNGKMEIESEECKGTTVTIHLPKTQSK
ncbi:MAG: ATP-binding protein [Deltaproteobacteria bacterium]